MADDDKTKTDPPANDDNKTDDQKAEESFWQKFDARLDEGVDRAIKKHVGNRDSRTGGRVTVPGLIADLMFGKKAPEDNKS